MRVQNNFKIHFVLLIQNLLQRMFKNSFFRLFPDVSSPTKISNDQVKLEQHCFFDAFIIGIYYFRLDRIKPHKHTYTSAILYITKGLAYGYVGKKKIVAAPGMFIYVPCNVEHHWVILKKLEYIEFSSPSLSITNAEDIKWKNVK